MKNHIYWQIKAFFSLLMIGCLSPCFGFYIQGPTSVCACGSDKSSCQNVYSVNNYGINDQIRWQVYDISANGNPMTESGDKFLAQGNSFIVNFSNSPGTSQLVVTTYWQGAAASTEVFYVQRYLAEPQSPNSGIIVFCSGNEDVSVTQPIIQACNFHYPFRYSAPSGFLISSARSYRQNPIPRSLDFNLTVTSPPSSPNGNVGLFYSTALWTEGGLSMDRTATSQVWYGSPTINSATVNGSNTSGMSYVPSGFANLSLSQGGGASYSWSITNGSGSLNPSGPNCQVSFSGFVRVVVNVSNRCGSTSFTFYLNQNNQYGGYAVSPNPSSSNMRISFADSQLPEEILTGITLISDKGKVLRSFSPSPEKKKDFFQKNKDVVFDVSDIQKGTYFLHVQFGEIVEKTQVLIN